MDEAGANPPQVGAEPPALPEPPPLSEPPAPPIDMGVRTPLVDIPRNLPTAYRSSATRGTVAVVLLGIAVVGYVAQALGQLSQLGMLDAAAAGTLTTAEALASDARVAGLGTLAFVTYLVSAIGVLVWLYRAVGNVPILTARALPWSPRAAVGWWFAPVANWVMPYRVVRDSFQALGGGASATMVTAWWACHVGSSILGVFVMASSASAMTTLDGIRSMVLITAAMIALEVVAGVLLVLVIRRLEGFARAWERGALVPQAAAPVWDQAAMDAPINPHAPEAWPDVAGALAAAAMANGETPVPGLPEAPPEDPRTIESVVVSAEGPQAPPSPPLPG